MAAEQAVTDVRQFLYGDTTFTVLSSEKAGGLSFFVAYCMVQAIV